MGVKDLVEVKFRLWDGTDMGPTQHSSAATIVILKEYVLAQWPKDKKYFPKTMSDVKLIYAGKILENHQTIAESRLSVVQVPGEVITMHVVLRPPPVNDKNGKWLDDHPKMNRCSCSIL